MLKTIRSKFFWAVLLIVGFAVGLRAWELTEVGLWHDEALSHFYASHHPYWIIRHCAGYINHPPMFFLLLHGWMSVVPMFDQFAVELINVLFGGITVGIVLVWSRSVVPDWVSWGLGLILALNSFHVYYSSELRMYALATMALTSAFYFSTMIVRDANHPIYYFGWSVSCLTALYSHSFTGIPVLFMMIFLGWSLISKGKILPYTYSVLMILIPYLPWFWFVFRQASEISSGYWIADFQWSYLATLFWMLGGYTGPKTLDTRSLLIISGITVGFGLPLIVSLYKLHREWVRFIWSVVVASIGLVVIISLYGQSVFLYRTFVVLVPASVILSGVGFSQLKPRWAIVLLVIYVGSLGFETYRLKKNPPHQYVKYVAELISKNKGAENIVVHTSRFTYFSSYFYHARKFPEYFLSTDSERRIGTNIEELKNHLTERGLFVVYPPDDRDRIPKTWLEEARWKTKKEWSKRKFHAIKVGPSKLKTD